MSRGILDTPEGRAHKNAHREIGKREAPNYAQSMPDCVYCGHSVQPDGTHIESDRDTGHRPMVAAG